MFRVFEFFFLPWKFHRPARLLFLSFLITPCTVFSLLLNIMNTFTAKNEKETQSLLQTKEEGETKKTISTARKNVLTLGGLAAVGILGLASSKSSSFGSAAPFNGSRLGQTQSTIRLSVGCSPQDVLSLLPFEPKSWRGTFIFLLYMYSISFSRLYSSRDRLGNFLLEPTTTEKHFTPKSCLTTKYDMSLTFFLHSTTI